jgi:ribokinase
MPSIRPIAVVGSLNMDFVVGVSRLPKPGETRPGHGFRTIPGGKGANQACAAGRLGGRCAMIGRVGEDVFGVQLATGLRADGVDVSGVAVTPGEPTGVALIFVEDGGQNVIVIAAGANGRLATEDLGFLAQSKDGLLLLQLESPPATVEAAAARGRALGMTTILDPAPARPLPPALLAHIDILTPNESEARVLLGQPPGDVTEAEAPAIAAALRRLGPRTAIVKMGGKGAWLDDGCGSRHIPGFAVKAVDTTAAGDTFNGALAVALAEGRPLAEAMRFANAAAAISVTRPGAQASIPSRADVDALLDRHGSA